MFATLGTGPNDDDDDIADAATTSSLNPPIRKQRAKKVTPKVTRAKKVVAMRKTAAAKKNTINTETCHKPRGAGPCNCKKCLAKEVIKKPKKVAQKSKTMKSTKKPRELVTNGQFMFKKAVALTWGPWKLAMSTEGKGRDHRGKWDLNRAGCVGFRRKDLYKDPKPQWAVYEVAVQPEKFLKKCVMYCKAYKPRPGQCWDVQMFPRELLTTCVTKALEQGGTIYVRRASCPPARKLTFEINGIKHKVKGGAPLKRLMQKIYDYAWVKRRNPEGYMVTRHVTRKLSLTKSCTLSGWWLP